MRELWGLILFDSLFRIKVDHPFYGLTADGAEADEALGKHTTINTGAIHTFGDVAGAFESPHFAIVFLIL